MHRTRYSMTGTTTLQSFNIYSKSSEKTFSLINGSKRTIKSDSNSFECLKRFKQSTKIDASPAKQARLSSATDVCRGDGCDYDADACESDGKLCTPINGGTLLAVLNDCSVGQKEQKHDSYTCGSASKDFGSTENLIEIAEKHNSHSCPDRPTQQTSTVKNLEEFSDQEEEDEDEEDDEEEAETEERDKVDSEESIGVVVKPRGRPPLNGLQVKRAHSPSSASRRMIRRRRHNWGPLGTKAKRRKQPLLQQPLSSSSQLDDYNCSIQDKSASNDNNSTQIVSAHSVLASSWVPAEPNNSGKRVDCGERRTSGLSPIREITGEPDLVQEREDEHYDESELDEYMAYLDELSSDDQPSEEPLGACQSDALVVADRQFRRTFETPVRYACEWDNCSDLFDSPKSVCNKITH
ncbi:unnamed protein product [Protopolystoma xenopodis]|uniref:Uncharacterized protein n=1 Tax=Protopolystoma xenopodis TaxID=117903 RepID=A0A3S5AJP4_9PLAT|nr:unnamed protein product [Protopolystoma xenopodis]